MNHLLDTAIRFPTPAKVAIYPFAPYWYSIVRQKPFARKGTGWFCHWFSFNTQPSLPYPIHNKSNPPDGAFVVDEKLV